jgi:ubiquinone/menaquinone biosynthesis C-methylase UbiE
MGHPVNILSELICPSCNASLALQKETSSHPTAEIASFFSCKACNLHFPVSSSMASFVQGLTDQENTASTFGFEWRAFWKGFFDKRDVFGLSFNETTQYFLSSVGLSQSDLKGLKILDAGTGSGRIPMSLQESGATVYAVDIHESLEIVAKHFTETNSAYFFRADLFQLPFRDDFFDVGWSSGVIHHTPDAAKAFAAIARKIKPGGQLFVSVYGKDLHHYRLFRRLLPFARHLPVYVTYLLSVVLAAFLYVGFNAALFLVRMFHRNQNSPYRFLNFTIENIGYKSYRSILLNLFDQLHPRFQSEHSVDEVQAWFAANGFRDTVIMESVGMVGIRGMKRK